MVAILGANSVSGGYEVSNSLRFNNDDSAFLSLTQTAGNRRLITFSTWLKRSSLGDQNIFNGGNSTSEFTALYFTSADELFLYDYRGAEGMSLKLNRKFRDVSAWYHIVVAFDTTQSTASNRVKFYVNGVQETSFSSSNYPAQNLDLMLNVNSSFTTRIGRYPTSSSLYFDGYMCETAVVEDSQLDPTSFGEFNDNNVWIPKDLSDLTFGDEGFYLKYKQTGTSQNSSGIGADSSGNDNHYAVSNFQAIDVTEDTCTNNFATLNPMIRNRYSNSKEPEDGNCAIRFTDTNGNIGKEFSTFGVNSGKWYWEVKVPVVARAYVGVGYMQEMIAFTNPYYDNNPSKGFALNYNGQLEYDSTSTSYGSSLSNNDIVQIALDMDNHLCWFGINGTWQNSATQSEIENSTASNDATTKMGTQQNLNSGEFVFAFVSDPSSSGMASFDINFGNPTFSISSSNNDGLYGNFEYAVPSGYYALCTKRLAEFG